MPKLSVVCLCLLSVSVFAAETPAENSPQPAIETVLTTPASDAHPFALQNAFETSPVTPPAAIPDISGLVREFDEFFLTEMRDRNVPGGVYAIVERDRIVKIRPFGVRQQGGSDPVDEHTVFRIASASKSFAGMLAAMLVHEGRFSWQDRVTDHVPGFRFKSSKHSQELRVEHLLAQSSGLMPNAFDNLIESSWEPDRILPKFSEVDPRCTPGKCYGYQNVLFSLIQPVLERSTKMTYASLITDRIFKPLGMPNASVGLEAFNATANRAMPHVRVDKKKFKPTRVKQDYYNFLPAAGVNASATDLGYWLMAQMGHFPNVIPAASIDDVTTRRVKTPKDLNRRLWREHLKNAHYGLGWRIYDFAGEELVYHGGWVSGFRTDMAYSPERGVGLVILLNAESEVISELSTYFWTHLLVGEPAAQKLLASTQKASARNASAVKVSAQAGKVSFQKSSGQKSSSKNADTRKASAQKTSTQKTAVAAKSNVAKSANNTSEKKPKTTAAKSSTANAAKKPVQAAKSSGTTKAAPATKNAPVTGTAKTAAAATKSVNAEQKAAPAPAHKPAKVADTGTQLSVADN